MRPSAARPAAEPSSALRRRDFVRLLAASAAGAVALRADAQPSAGAPPRPAQDAATGLPVESPTPSQITGAPVTAPETPGATMQGEGYRPVRLPAKPGVFLMCSTLCVQAAWSRSLCSGPSTSNTNSEVRNGGGTGWSGGRSLVVMHRG